MDYTQDSKKYTLQSLMIDKTVKMQVAETLMQHKELCLPHLWVLSASYTVANSSHLRHNRTHLLILGDI